MWPQPTRKAGLNYQPGGGVRPWGCTAVRSGCPRTCGVGHQQLQRVGCLGSSRRAECKFAPPHASATHRHVQPQQEANGPCRQGHRQRQPGNPGSAAGGRPESISREVNVRVPGILRGGRDGSAEFTGGCRRRPASHYQTRHAWGTGDLVSFLNNKTETARQLAGGGSRCRGPCEVDRRFQLPFSLSFQSVTTLRESGRGRVAHGAVVRTPVHPPGSPILSGPVVPSAADPDSIVWQSRQRRAGAFRARVPGDCDSGDGAGLQCHPSAHRPVLGPRRA